LGRDGHSQSRAAAPSVTAREGLRIDRVYE
jgi:hypothetical protein